MVSSFCALYPGKFCGLRLLLNGNRGYTRWFLGLFELFLIPAVFFYSDFVAMGKGFLGACSGVLFLTGLPESTGFCVSVSMLACNSRELGPGLG